MTIPLRTVLRSGNKKQSTRDRRRTRGRQAGHNVKDRHEGGARPQGVLPVLAPAWRGTFLLPARWGGAARAAQARFDLVSAYRGGLLLMRPRGRRCQAGMNAQTIITQRAHSQELLLLQEDFVDLFFLGPDWPVVSLPTATSPAYYSTQRQRGMSLVTRRDLVTASTS